MRKIEVVCAIAAMLLFSACVKEQDLTPVCAKWQVEINNPEATVSFENGYLIIEIPNPKTEKDVRLIQYQDESFTSSKGGTYVQGGITEILPTETNSFSPHIKASFAYQAKPDDFFVSTAVGFYGKRGYYNGKEVYTNLNGGALEFFGEGTMLKFEQSSSPNSTVEVSSISAEPKIYYLDFGINPFWTRSIPVEFIRIELDHVFFGDHVGEGVALSGSWAEETFGFKNDVFDCNSIK